VAVVLGSLAKFCNLVVVLYDWTFGLYAALAIQVQIQSRLVVCNKVLQGAFL
jgi:hypothetical protein